jgi:hypothetical protein
VQIVQLLVNGRRWGFKGTDAKELAGYKTTVLAGLEQEWAKVPRWDPTRPETSETMRTSGRGDAKFDMGELGDKMIKSEDFERCEESTTDADERLFKLRSLGYHRIFAMKIINRPDLKC